MFTKKLMRFAAIALLIGTMCVQGANATQGKKYCHGKRTHCHAKKECPSMGNHKMTCTAMGKAGMCHEICCKKGVTIFAPTDAAWEKMPKANRDALMADHKALHKLMSYHVVPRTLSEADLQSMRSAPTMEGDAVMINHKDNMIMIDGAIVQGSPKKHWNTTVYEIDDVLTPGRGK